MLKKLDFSSLLSSKVLFLIALTLSISISTPNNAFCLSPSKSPLFIISNEGKVTLLASFFLVAYTVSQALLDIF